MKIKELVPLIVIISVTLTIGGILIASHVLPEETVKNFNPLNPIAEQALHIALNDSKIKQTIDEQKGKAVTIAAIQPTSVLQGKDRKTSYSPTGPGQIIITSNWQYVDGNFYSNTANFNQL